MPSPNEDFAATNGIDPDAFGASLFDSPEPRDESSRAVSSPEHSTPSGESSTPPAADVKTTPVPEGAENAGITQEAWDALPKSWRKDMEASWKTATPEVRKYVHERETQIQHGINQYRSGADNWNKVVSPFQEVLREYPDANITEILSTLANNHLQMVRASPAERVQHALALARGYGVELTVKQAQALAENVAEGGAPQAATPQAEGFSPSQLAYLERTFGPVVANARQSAEYVQSQLQTAAEAEVDKFFSDPKNEFVHEVGNDILAIMQARQAKNLAEAYEIAVLRNPAVKPRYVASLAAKSAPPPSSAPTLPNVKSSATPIKAPKKTGSIDDTIADVIAKHYT